MTKKKSPPNYSPGASQWATSGPQMPCYVVAMRQHAGKPATDGWFSTAWYSIEKWDFNGDLIGV